MQFTEDTVVTRADNLDNPAAKRRALILALITKKPIGSQAKLAEALSGYGVEVTQATLSRDLKALRVVKVANAEGHFRYQTLGEPVTGKMIAQSLAEQQPINEEAIVSPNDVVLASDLLDRVQALEEAVFGRSLP